MKSNYYILFIILAIVFNSCKSSNTPEAAASKFILSMRSLDFETAKGMSTKATWNLINIMDAHTKNVSDEEKQQLAENFKINISTVESESDSTVLVSYTTEPQFVIVPKLRLIREYDIDGRTKWKIDISSLDNLLMGEEDYIEEKMMPVMDEDSTAIISAETDSVTSEKPKKK